MLVQMEGVADVDAASFFFKLCCSSASFRFFGCKYGIISYIPVCHFSFICRGLLVLVVVGIGSAAAVAVAAAGRPNLFLTLSWFAILPILQFE